MKVDNEPSGAVFTDDRTHRLYLWRRWGKAGPWVMFIGLNPSTADERLNDPTVRRCIGFAQKWGYSGMFMCNAYTLVSTDPKKLNAEAPIVKEAQLAMRVIRNRCEYITETIEVPVRVEIIKAVPIEIVKKVPMKLREFNDVNELEKFLEESDADSVAYLKFDKDGTVDLTLRDYDCEDYAIALRDLAHEAGYLMSFQLVKNYRMPNGKFLTSHALNSVIIGNELYFIEPQTDEYWLETRLD